MPPKKQPECKEGKMNFPINKIDCEVMQKLKNIADKSKRSMNKEIIMLIENHVAANYS